MYLCLCMALDCRNIFLELTRLRPNSNLDSILLALWSYTTAELYSNTYVLVYLDLFAGSKSPKSTVMTPPVF